MNRGIIDRKKPYVDNSPPQHIKSSSSRVVHDHTGVLQYIFDRLDDTIGFSIRLLVLMKRRRRLSLRLSWAI